MIQFQSPVTNEVVAIALLNSGRKIKVNIHKQDNSLHVLNTYSSNILCLPGIIF
jgi:hypothetical protein